MEVFWCLVGKANLFIWHIGCCSDDLCLWYLSARNESNIIRAFGFIDVKNRNSNPLCQSFARVFYCSFSLCFYFIAGIFSQKKAQKNYIFCGFLLNRISFGD